MNLAPEPVKPCPRCGDVPDTAIIGGLCPKCFALVALDAESGWLANAPSDVSPDAWPTLAGWDVVGILGAGGMGRVYRAESINDGTPGALKVLEAKWSHDPLMSARFEAEAAALKKLQHENIVRVIETGETDDGRFCLVMELVDGCDLGRLLRAEKLSAERAIDIFRKVCAAVSHAHEHGFAHRDIKPANILTARDGTVKLVDFGLAKNLDHSSTVGALTATMDHFGTAYYLAPERMLDKNAAGPPADIYALGVLLYHLLTGQMPLGKYTPVSQLTGLPASFDAIIGKALEADPANRTASASVLEAEVAAAWNDHVTGGQRIRQRKRMMRIAAAVIFAALTAVGGALWQRERMKPPPPPVFRAPSTASLSDPWENSLGMKFVPVPGTKVLFSIWESRRRDVEPFVAAMRQVFNEGWQIEVQQKISEEGNRFLMLGPGGRIQQTASWNDPGFPITPDHPACFANVRESQRYCLWLTWKEINEGRLKQGQRYRLPTDAEWLFACGGENATPRLGNLAGAEARDDHWPPLWPTFADRDAFPRLAPVGSFPAEMHGLFDISGNVSEWVIDTVESSAQPVGPLTSAKLRGPNFLSNSSEKATFTMSLPGNEARRWPTLGFRVVLELEAVHPGS